MSRLRPRTVFLVVAGLAIFVAAKTDKPVESVWTAAPVPVDGLLAGWPGTVLQSYRHFDLRFGFMNDDKNLYGVVAFDNPRYLTSLEFSGITLWIHPDKDKRTYGLRFYQKMATADETIERIESQGTPLTQEQKARLRTRRRYRLYACDAVDGKGDLVPRKPDAPAATCRFGRVEKSVVVALTVPLGLLAGPDVQSAWDAGKPFKVGFEWGGLNKDMKKQMAEMGPGEPMSGDPSLTANVGVLGFMGGQGEAIFDKSCSACHPSGGHSMPDIGAMNVPFLGNAGISTEGRLPHAPKYDFWIELKLGEKK
jgi:hypothetical protein